MRRFDWTFFPTDSGESPRTLAIYVTVVLTWAGSLGRPSTPSTGKPPVLIEIRQQRMMIVPPWLRGADAPMRWVGRSGGAAVTVCDFEDVLAAAVAPKSFHRRTRGILRAAGASRCRLACRTTTACAVADSSEEDRLATRRSQFVSLGVSRLFLSRDPRIAEKSRGHERRGPYVPSDASTWNVSPAVRSRT